MNNPYDTLSERGRVWQAATNEAYNEALLDVFDFMTGNPLILDVDPARYAKLEALAQQVNRPVLQDA